MTHTFVVVFYSGRNTKIFFLYNSALKFYPLHSIGITLEDQETQHIFLKILNKTCFHLILSLSASTLLISLINSFKTCSLKYNPSVDEKNNNNMIESRLLTNIYFVTFSQLHFLFCNENDFLLCKWKRKVNIKKMFSIYLFLLLSAHTIPLKVPRGVYMCTKGGGILTRVGGTLTSGGGGRIFYYIFSLS